MPDAFLQSLSKEARAAFLAAEGSDDVAPILDQARPSPLVARELARALKGLPSSTRPLAVRSSAPDEDSAALSFAGQLESYLAVKPQDVAKRLAMVWRSGFSARIIDYRRQAGLQGLPSPPAVIVQEVVDGEVSGVAFSADPVSGRRGVALVSAIWGLGAPLVSGEVDADTWHVDRSEKITDERIANKRRAQRRDGRSGKLVLAELSPKQSQQPTLQPNQVRAVAALARQAQQIFGTPQDIEWTLLQDELYLLQSRPITTLAGKADPDETLAIWDNANIVENYGGVTTPLTFSFVRHIYEGVYRDLCRRMGVSAREIATHASVFRGMIGMVQGRIYYNLVNWYRILAMLPTFRGNRVFLDQMLGVRDAAAGEGEVILADALAMQRTNILRRARGAWTLVSNHIMLPQRIAAFRRHIDATLGARRPALWSFSPDELVAHYRFIERRLEDYGGIPGLNDFAVMVFHGLLRRWTAAWLPDGREALLDDLLSGGTRSVNHELRERLERLATLALRTPGLAPALVHENAGKIHTLMRQAAEFEAEYRDYLERFGDRSADELKLESPSFHDQPLPLLRAIGQIAQQASTVPADEGNGAAMRRKQAERQVRWALARHPLRRVIFAWALCNARSRLRDRENLRFDRTRVFGRARRVAVELGRRLTDLGVLYAPEDVFYLDIEELLSFVEARAASAALRDIVAVRKGEFQAYRDRAPPLDRFLTRGIPNLGDIAEAVRAEKPIRGPKGATATGLGCCAGQVEGPVRIVRMAAEARLEPGEIVAVERIDPGWIVLLTGAAGLLVERGNLLSHAAIIAREASLPTIVSVPGLLAWLSDGERVRMDGGSGTITKVETPVGSAS